MTTLQKWAGVLALVAVVIAIGAYWYPKVGGTSFGTAVDCGSTTCFTTLGALTSFQDDGTAQFNGAATFASTVTFSGAITNAATSTTKNIVVTTSNTATSSIQVGCIQTTATSTATPVHFSLTVSQTASTTFDGTGQGNVMWQFGKCPGV